MPELQESLEQTRPSVSFQLPFQWGKDNDNTNLKRYRIPSPEVEGRYVASKSWAESDPFHSCIHLVQIYVIGDVPKKRAVEEKRTSRMTDTMTLESKDILNSNLPLVAYLISSSEFSFPFLRKEKLRIRKSIWLFDFGKDNAYLAIPQGSHQSPHPYNRCTVSDEFCCEHLSWNQSLTGLRSLRK